MNQSKKIQILQKHLKSSCPFRQYIEQVFSHPEEHCEEEMQQCLLQLEMLEIYDFKANIGDYAVWWIENFCFLTEGENAGQKVKLMLWQKWVIYSIFCFFGHLDVEEFDLDGNFIGIKKKYVRVVNDVLVLIASGNSKTTFMSFIVEFILYADPRFTMPSPKIFIGSNAYKQSRIGFDAVSKSVRKNVKLKSITDLRESYGELEIKKHNAKLNAMSSDGSNLEGIIYAVLWIDEIHEMKTSKYCDDLRKSCKRSDALVIETTTEGDVRNGYLDQRTELAHKLLFGATEEKDYRKFFAFFKQESYEEVVSAYRNNQINILKKSNPGLGVSVSVELLKEKIVDMLNDSKKRVTTLTKNFNIPQNPITSYFSEKECRTKKFNEDIFYGCPVFLGLDMAYTRNPSNDLACLEMLTVNPITEEEYCKDFYFLPKYWEQELKEGDKVNVVKDSMIKAKSKEDANILYNPRQEKYGYQLYADNGHLVIVNEELVDELVSYFGEQARNDCTGITEDFIIYYICYLEIKYNWTICKVGLDPNKASKIEAFLNANIPRIDDNYPVVKFRMEDKKNSNPIIESTKEIRDRKLVYNNNKLTELHFANAQAKEDKYGNITFTNSQRERKDGVIANLAARSAYNVFVNNKKTGIQNLEMLTEWWQVNGTRIQKDLQK